MKNKEFKTVDEQLKILRSRGLTIEDDVQAKEFLLHNNYYRVSGYSLTLLEQKPSLNKSEKSLLIVDKNGRIDNSHFYGFVLIMKRLLTADKFSEMKNAILALTNKYPFVRMDYYGFRNDWKEKL